MWGDSPQETRKEDAKGLLQVVLQGGRKSEFFNPHTFPFLATMVLVYISLWVTISIGNAPLVQWMKPPPPHEPEISMFYSTAVLVFFVAFTVDVMGWVYTVNPLKRRLYSVICFVNLTSAFTYLTLLLGFGPTWTNFAGRSLHPHLYMEWVATTPSLIFLCSQLSSASKAKVAFIIFSDLCMIVTGLISSVVSVYPWYWFFYGVSILFAVPTFVGVYLLMGQAVKAAAVKSDVRSLKTLRNVTLLVWAVFPIVWHCAAVNLISQSTEALLFAILDVNAKAIYSAVLLGHNFFTIDQLQALNNLNTKKQEDHTCMLDESLNEVQNTDTVTKLLALAKMEVENTQQLQCAFLLGVVCSGALILFGFYMPYLKSLS